MINKLMQNEIVVEIRWKIRRSCLEYIWILNDGKRTYRYDLCHRNRFHRGACSTN